MKFPVKVIFENYGTVGGARQVGVENAYGDYIAFTDSDCIPDKQWLEMLLMGCEPGIVGVGGGIKNIGNGIWEESIALALNSFLGSANSVQDRLFTKKKFVRSISGCNSLYRKSYIEKIGGFNVKYRFNEDTDLNKRIAKFGLLLYTPDAIVLHNQSRNLRQFAKRMFYFGYGRGMSKIFDLQVLPPVSLIFIALCLVFFPIIFFALVIIYAVIILFFSSYIAYKNRKFRYFMTLPIIFLFEHSMYSIGFWYGILKSFPEARK
jgi:cellulose synthase/poly-beta-1,6-N-acetylglucosamine synthase-like glycosyltransferase